MFESEAIVKQLLEREVFQLILILHFDLDLFVLLNVFETEIVLRKVDVRYAFVVLQVLRQDEQVFRMQSNIDEDELSQLIRLYVVQRHVTSIDLQLFDSMFENELGQVLETELYHFLVLEVDQFRYESFAEVFVR